MNKYIFKGSDKAQIAVTGTNNAKQHPADEHPSSEKADTPSHLGSSTLSSSSSSISIIQSADLPMVSSSSSSTSIPASLIHNTKDNTTTTDNTKSVLIDEIKQYCDCRYIGPSEAHHRLFGLKLHGAKPAVVRMQVHLPDK